MIRCEALLPPVPAPKLIQASTLALGVPVQLIESWLVTLIDWFEIRLTEPKLRFVGVKLQL